MINKIVLEQRHLYLFVGFGDEGETNDARKKKVMHEIPERQSGQSVRTFLTKQN